MVPQPDVLCLPELGCLIDEYEETVSYNVVYYSQKVSSYIDVLMHLDYPTHCETDLWDGGCAVASMTMMLNYYRGHTTQVVSLTSVNNTVDYSCSYAYDEFEDAYPNDVYHSYISSTWRTDKSAILNLVGPKINSTLSNTRS